MANNNIQARLADLRQRNAARTGRDGQEPAGSRPAGGSIQDRLAELRQRNAQRQVKEQSTPTADRARLGLATGGNPVSSSLTRFTRERESEAMARTGSEAEALKLQMDTLSAQKAALEEGLPKLRAAEQPSEVARESLMRTAQGWSQRQELGQEPERGSDRVSARIEALERERSALLPQYYAAKNEATLRRMEGDAALKSLYAQAKALREDLDRAGLVETGTGTENGEAYRAAWDGMKEKYGVSRAAELPALHERLLREFDALEEQLAAQGVDYEYLRAYEQMTEDRAAWEEKQAETEAYAREHPVMASVESVLKSPMQGLDLLSLGTPGAGRNDPDSPDTYVPLNVYGMDVSNFVNTVRGTVSEEIEQNTDWELFGQNVASFLYQTGMSVADSAAQVALFGPGATYLMGASAAANQAREVIERGGTNRQALLSGLAAGAAEALFEKVSVERLLSERSVRSMRDLLAETLKQAGTEASEEMLTEVSNLLSDAAIMGSGSSFAAMVDRHRQEGLSEEAARRRAFLDCLSQVSLAGVGGALSGGVMGGTVRGANYLSGAWNQVQNARASRPTNEQLLSSLNQRLSQPGQVEADLRPYSVLNGTENSAVDALQERTESAFREELRRQLTGSPAVEATGQNNTAGQAEPEQANYNEDAAAQDEISKIEAHLNSGKRKYGEWYVAITRASQRDGASITIYKKNGEKVKTYIEGGKYFDNKVLNNIAANMIVEENSKKPPRHAQVQPESPEASGRDFIFTEASTGEAGSVKNNEDIDQLLSKGRPAPQAMAGVREETIQTAQRLSDILGRNIRFYDGNTRQDASGGANGYYVRGEDTIYINSRSRNPVAQIISHELTHSVELAGAYEDLSGLVLNRIRQTGGNLEQLRQEKAELYAGRGAQLASQEEIDREIVAQYVERHLLTDEQSIRELTQQNRSLGQRILSWLNELLAKLGNTRAQERAFLTRARDAYSRALQESADIQRNRQEAQEISRGLQEDYVAGAISEEEFDAGMDAVMERENLGRMSALGQVETQRPQHSEKNQGLLELRKQLENGEITEDEYDALFDQYYDPEQEIQYSIDGQDTDRADSLGEEIRRQIYGENTALDRGRETDYDGGRAAELTAEEEAALLDYKSGGSYQLNAALRDGYPLDQMQYRTVEALDAALEKLPPYQGTVYRRVGFDSIGGQEALDAFLAEHRAGEIIRYPAYTSTSTSPDGYPVDGELTVTAIIEGRNGRDLDGYGNNFEREILFPRDTIFHIERVEQDAQGKPVIYMREVLDNGTGQLYSQERHGGVQPVQEVPQGDDHLREIPGVDPQAEAGGALRGLRSGRAEGEGKRGVAAQLQEGDGGEGRALQGTEGEGLNGSDIRYSVDEAESGPKAAEDIISTMPVKAQQYLRRAESYLTAKVGNLLSVPRYAQRGYLRDIVREISLEYLREGRVSGETIDGLFDRAYDGGVVADREFYDQYRDLRDYLRSTRLTISRSDSADIPDFNDFRKSNFGRLNISTQGGTNIDRVYQELESVWPEFFSEERQSNPSDQLQHIADVAKSFQVVEKNLDEYYGPKAAEFRRWARHDFEAAIQDGLSELRRVRRYVQERETQATTAETVPTTQEEVAQMWGQLKQARRTYEKAAARNLLTQHDQVQVGRLLRGEIELEHLNEKTDNVKGIREVYQAKLEYERLTRLIRQWNQSRKDALRQQADRYLQTANDWKDKRAGIMYSRETMERNIRDIINDEALAGEINQTYFAPVHDAAAAANRMKNQYRDRVRELNLSRNVAKGNTVSEAHAVQLLGEAEDNIRILEQSRGRLKERDGKSLEDWRGIVDGLWEENPNLDAEKIRAAVEQFRTIYDELFQQMNEVRVRNGYEPVNYRSGYFPHFQPGNGDGILAQFGKALGIDTEVTALPTTINGLTHTFRPGIRWFGNAQERLGFNTTYDAVEGFDRYIEGVADVIHQTDNIQRLRALASQARYRTGDEGIRRQVDEVRANPSLTEEDKQNRIEKIYEKGRFALSNFVVELEEYTNLLANKKSRADRNMEQALGRNMYNLVKALESRVAANMVAVNPASWVTNFIPLTQGGSLLDRGMLLKGMWDTLKAYKADDGIVDKSSFLTNRRGSDPLVRTWAQKASATASRPMEYIDQFVADSLVRARYRQNLGKGLSEDAAMSEADAWVAGVMADRSKGSTPTLFNRSNPITKVFTQFQLEVNNQLSYLFKDIPRDVKDRGLVVLVAALLKFFLGAWLFNEVYEFVIGRRPALDPIGILNDTVGDLTGWELPNLVELSVGAASGNLPSFEVEQTGLSEAGRNLAGDVLEQLPFIGGVLGGGRVPISSAVPDFGNLWDAATEDGWSTEKRLQEVRDELLEKPVAYLGLPFGGGQIKKIYEAIEGVIQGGSYSINAEGDQELQYPIYNDTPSQAIGNALLGSTFGRTSLPTGREWIEEGFGTLGAKQTAVYQGLLEAGVSGEEAYALLKELRGAEKTGTESEAAQERRLLQEADISGEGKSIVYYGLMASDRERALMDDLADMDADMGEVTTVLLGIKDAGALKGAAASNAKRDAIAGAALPEDEQIQLYNYTFGDEQDDGSYASSRAGDIAAFQEAGLTFDQFLEAQNEYSTIDEEYDSSGEKAVEFARWVNGQGLTGEQAAVVKDAFTYYSQIPQSGGYYEKFTAAGMSDESAYSLNQALDELEPLEGEDKVSSLQKYQAVVNSDLTESEQMTAMGELMPEAEYRKLRISGQYDISPAQYIRYREMLASADALNEDPEKRNKSIDQDEAAAAINGMLGLTGEQKAALWQLQNKSWKPNRNPFNTAAGQAVYNYLHDEGLPSLTGGGELPPLPSLGG